MPCMIKSQLVDHPCTTESPHLHPKKMIVGRYSLSIVAHLQFVVTLGMLAIHNVNIDGSCFDNVTYRSLVLSHIYISFALARSWTFHLCYISSSISMDTISPGDAMLKRWRESLLMQANTNSRPATLLKTTSSGKSKQLCIVITRDGKITNK